MAPVDERVTFIHFLSSTKSLQNATELRFIMIKRI